MDSDIDKLMAVFSGEVRLVGCLDGWSSLVGFDHISNQAETSFGIKREGGALLKKNLRVHAYFLLKGLQPDFLLTHLAILTQTVCNLT